MIPRLIPCSAECTRPLFDDSEHEAAERQAREQADFDALLVELWGPMEPAGADRAGEAGAPEEGGKPGIWSWEDWRDRLTS